jgi:hypothetical protein
MKCRLTKRNTFLNSAHRGLSDGMPIYMVSIVSYMCQWYQKCQWYHHTCIPVPEVTDTYCSLKLTKSVQYFWRKSNSDCVSRASRWRIEHTWNCPNRFSISGWRIEHIWNCPNRFSISGWRIEHIWNCPNRFSISGWRIEHIWNCPNRFSMSGENPVLENKQRQLLLGRVISVVPMVS